MQTVHVFCLFLAILDRYECIKITLHHIVCETNSKFFTELKQLFVYVVTFDLKFDLLT